MTVRDRLARRAIPRLVIALSRIDWPARLGARLRRATGRSGRVELYFAFDDPCSAVALLELVDRVGTRDVELVPLPVVQRGIPGDPAVEDKRRYALVDAQRLAARSGRSLGRTAPLDAAEAAFLAEWATATSPNALRERFCERAVGRLWFDADAGERRVDPADYALLWQGRPGSRPPTSGTADEVRGNERRMRKRGPYDVPAAWVHGQWFFAQDRLDQIEHRLDELGWTATR